MTVTVAERSEVVRRALRQIGWPYRYGGSNSSGVDCSGATRRAWAPYRTLPHNAQDQADKLSAVPATIANRRKLRPGDLVFYYGRPSIRSGQIVEWVIRTSHVALYVGKQGHRRQVVQATNEARGVEQVWIRAYARPTAYGFIGHH